jgi:hypothetical protein
LLWAVGVLAIEVLLLWGYFALVEVGSLASYSSVALALLVGTLSVMVWLGFAQGFEQTWRRLLLTVIGCVVVTYAALVVAGPLLELPAVVVCERGPTPNVEVSSTRIHGYFEERRVGPCVTYTHHSRPHVGGQGGD